MIPVILPFAETLLELFFRVFDSCVALSMISGTSRHLFPLGVPFSLRNRKMSLSNKSGEYNEWGTSGIFVVHGQEFPYKECRMR